MRQIRISRDFLGMREQKKALESFRQKALLSFIMDWLFLPGPKWRLFSGSDTGKQPNPDSNN